VTQHGWRQCFAPAAPTGVVALLIALAAAGAQAQGLSSGVASGTAVLMSSGPGHTSLTVLKVDAGGAVVPGTAPIQPGDAVKLRGDGNRWAAAAAGVPGAAGVRLVAAPEASTFRVTSVPSPAATPQVAILVEPFTASTAFVTLGTGGGAPCARLEPTPSGTPDLPALRLTTQQVTAYADVRIGNPVVEYYAPVQACVGEATAATGLTSILSAPASTLPGFTAAFAACLAARAPLTHVQYVRLRTEAACHD